MIDLHDLKGTNDSLGHEMGDESIVAICNIITKVFAESSVYRVGGDEFVVISEGDEVDKVLKLEQKFISIIERASKNLSKNAVPVSAAIGTAIFDPKTDNNVEDTFKRADAKMYENKKDIKGHKN